MKMVKGIEHVAIFSRDTKALSEWYARMFDLKLVYDNGKGTYFLAFPSGDMIEFVSAAKNTEEFDDKASGLRHLAFSVDKKNFEPMVNRLKESGAQIVTDVSVSSKGIKTFFFRDIDGNVSHLIYRPEPLV